MGHNLFLLYKTGLAVKLWKKFNSEEFKKKVKQINKYIK